MKRLFAVLAGAVLAVSAAGAQDTKTVKGTVSAMGPATITVKVGDTDMTFNVDAKTDLTARGGSTATRAARAEGKTGPTLTQLVKVGESVEIRYHDAGMHAASIRVLPAGASLAAPAVVIPTKSASGVVTALTGTSVTIKAKDAEWTFVIDPKTAVIGRGLGTKTAEKKAAGEKTMITDLVAAGDTVTVRFKEVDGGKHASQVKVDRKAPVR